MNIKFIKSHFLILDMVIRHPLHNSFSLIILVIKPTILMIRNIYKLSRY